MNLIARRITAGILTLFLISLPAIIFAQDCPDIGGVDPDNPCPIDSWVFVLLIAGIVYGMVKAKVFRKRTPLSK